MEGQHAGMMLGCLERGKVQQLRQNTTVQSEQSMLMNQRNKLTELQSHERLIGVQLVHHLTFARKPSNIKKQCGLIINQL